MHRNPQAADGLIIFLNGTSSSGKSSIARELVAVLGEPCFHMPVDAFHAMRSTPEMPPDQLNITLKRTWMGFHRAVAGMAAAGNTVVVDHVLSEPWRLQDCLALFPLRTSSSSRCAVHCRSWSGGSRRAVTVRQDWPPASSTRSIPTVSTTSSATPAVRARPSVPGTSRSSSAGGRHPPRSNACGRRCPGPAHE